jgi:adenylosuccinate synthase
MVNGFDTLMITKLDVLDQLEEIPVCIGYKLCGADVTEMPATYRALEAVQPVYKMMPGWLSATRGIARYDDLPDRAREYLAFLEDSTRVEIGGVSTGPERNETIIRTGSKLERLIQ